MNLNKNNAKGLFLYHWFGRLKGKSFSEISVQVIKKVAIAVAGVLLVAFFLIYFEVYIPLNPDSHELVTFTVQKGWGDKTIAVNLQKLGIIRSSYSFQLYTVLSFKHINLQAGKYNLSARMSIYEIANKMAQGDVVKEKIVILEGWDEKDIGMYLESKGACKKEDFFSLIKNDYSADFDFLGDKPKDADLEGYLFPDTYEVLEGENCEGILYAMLSNFDQKLSPELRDEIASQKKSIFDVVTMASMIEKEVRTMDDKKIVSGILWKRIAIGMPLQLDATINYITEKSDASVLIKDTKIDSPYNTYKYRGMPKGPISNPGINSITAAIYPVQTKYWFYLSDGTTHFSETLDQHNAAKAKYLGY
jgi:UPF0755 protein